MSESSNQNVLEELERLRAENEVLKKGKMPSGQKEISFKIGEKGGLSVYGLGRFPVTLYKEQWIRLLDKEKDIREFLVNNADKLKSKE